MADWHFLFGASLADVVAELPLDVRLELELSQVRERLDVALLRKSTVDRQQWQFLPDGLTELSDHNLLTFRPVRKSLAGPTMCEIVSHTVQYAKQQWKKEWEVHFKALEHVRPFAVGVHRPNWLRPDRNADQCEVVPGVYDLDVFGLTIRLIIVREVARAPRNALWHLLSGDAELVAYGAQHFQIQDPMSYNTLDDLKRQYALEGIDVTIAIEELREDARRRFVEELSVRERLEGLSAPERLEGLSAEEIRAYLEQLERSRPDDENGAAS